MVSPDSVVTMRAGREPSKIGNPTAGPNVNASRNFPGTCWHATRCPPSSTRYGLPAMTTRAPTAGLVRPRRWWPQSAHSCRPAIGSDQTNGPQRAPGAAPGRLRSRNHTDSQGQGNRRLTYLYLETEDERTGELLVWTIQELRSARSLANEGHAMGHCLSSKAVKLATTSIWSVQVRDGERSRRVMTVGMVAPASRGDSARGKPSCWLRPIPFCASGSTARRSPTASWSCNPPGIRLALIRGPDQLRRMTASSTAGAADAKI